MIVGEQLSWKKIFFSFLFLFGFTYCHETSTPEARVKSLSVEYKELTSADDIIEINDSLVAPVIYAGTINLDHLPIDVKKKKFIDMMLPAVLYAKHNIEKIGIKIEEFILTLESGDSLTYDETCFLEQKIAEYKAADIYDLREKLSTHPVSIVLAQAAIESGWGTSRFFLEANNVFGIWSFDKQEDRIKARYQRNGKSIYVRKYNHLSGSIEDYFVTLARAQAYSLFRKKRNETDNVFEMVNYLNRYSEMGYDYVTKLKYVIRNNELTKYDNYRLDPSYFIDVDAGEQEPLLALR